MQVSVAAIAKTAGANCKNADMPLPSGRRPSADDLLVLLAVGRSGRYSTAAEELGLNHTTISRRIAALERSIGGRVLARVGGGWELTDLGREALTAAEAVESAVRSLTADPGAVRTMEGVVRISATDGFSAYIAAPAAAQVQRRHPRVAVEIVAATRRATQQRSGLDVEVVVGEPKVRRARAIQLGDYCLGLYGSRDYLAEHGSPTSVPDLARYPLIYFIDSMLQVDDLDIATSFAPAMRESVTSTNVFVHVEATRAAAGIGLLPCFMADRHDDLVRVLPDAVAIQLTYWLVTRAETLRRPEVAAVVDAIRARVQDQRDMLLGVRH
jgi:DNA-binding transcriptional LysR family regulator